jgi:thiol-disulfide isomerase/thioredoxin
MPFLQSVGDVLVLDQSGLLDDTGLSTENLSIRIFMKTTTLAAAVTLTLAAGSAFAHPQTSAPDAVVGRWDAALLNNGPPVPFRLDIGKSGSGLKGVFYDGFRPYDATTSVSFQGGKLVLKAEHYLTTITAALKHGELSGTTQLQGPGYSLKYDFHAVRHIENPTADGNAPSIAGSWEIPLKTPSAKGEKAFRLIVDQHGADVAASILRVDGDTGAYSGHYQDGKWVLSHFDGHRPGVVELSTTQDGTLEVVAHNEALKKALDGNDNERKNGEDKYTEGRYEGTEKYVAYRSAVARAKGLPEPENYETHTTARDANEKFAFNFPDVEGKLVSNEDPRFKGKVVLAIVTGTWCPNCHDEAQYLVELDKKYRDKGLAIVALDFEEPEQQKTLERERAFVKQYGVKYTYLIAGAPSEMWEKVPQLSNLNTWPATVFVGRDGLVKSVHSGFASPASGEFNRQLQEEFTAKIEHLLSENSPTVANLQQTSAGIAAE